MPCKTQLCSAQPCEDCVWRQQWTYVTSVWIWRQPKTSHTKRNLSRGWTRNHPSKAQGNNGLWSMEQLDGTRGEAYRNCRQLRISTCAFLCQTLALSTSRTHATFVFDLCCSKIARRQGHSRLSEKEKEIFQFRSLIVSLLAWYTLSEPYSSSCDTTISQSMGILIVIF